MTLKALCLTLGLLGLLSGDAIASPFNDGDGRSNIKTEEAIELFVTCEASFPLLSLRWDDRDNAKAAETASTFLNVPSITPQVIIDRAAECFSTLKYCPPFISDKLCWREEHDVLPVPHTEDLSS
jgi:hypothetical protein